MAHILIIEDSPAVLLSLRIVLEGAGHHISMAKDGGAGLQMLDSSNFDLVITDIWMPGVNGAEVIREGKQRFPATQFLAITGGDPNSPSIGEPLRPHEFGADGVLQKPFEKKDLLDAVAQLVTPADG
jgi:CheY-like chemotaxis protein